MSCTHGGGLLHSHTSRAAPVASVRRPPPGCASGSVALWISNCTSLPALEIEMRHGQAPCQADTVGAGQARHARRPLLVPIA